MNLQLLCFVCVCVLGGFCFSFGLRSEFEVPLFGLIGFHCFRVGLSLFFEGLGLGFRVVCVGILTSFVFLAFG